MVSNENLDVKKGMENINIAKYKRLDFFLLLISLKNN